MRHGLEYAREHRLLSYQSMIARDAAGLEAIHGEREQALVLFDTTLDSLLRAGNIVNVGATLANLVGLFERFEQPAIAATIYSTCTRSGINSTVINLAGFVDRLRVVLGDSEFDQSVGVGAAMEPADAVRYARQQIQLARRPLGDVS